MYFGIIDQLQCHDKIGNIKLICLKILVVAVCVSLKYLSIWNIFEEMAAV